MNIIVDYIAENVLWLNDNPLRQSKSHNVSVRLLVDCLKTIEEHWFSSTLFVISPRPSFVRDNLSKNKYRKTYSRIVVLILSQESGLIEWIPNKNNNEYLFQCYLKEPQPSGSNIFPLPLIIPYYENKQPLIPLQNRNYSVFFSGNLNRNRWELYLGLGGGGFIDKVIYKLKNLPGIARIMYKRYRESKVNVISNSFVKFNNGFFSGLPLSEYNMMLRNSKIVLSPRGFSSHECYRTYESLKAGCVVISETLPDFPFYKDIPLVQIDNWLNIHSLLTELLSSPLILDEMSSKSIAFYEKHLSIQAIAGIINENAK